MWRLRFAALFTFGALVFLAGRALAETNADAPTGKADAVIDLATKEGVDLVKVGGVIATPKSSTSISRRLAPTNNRPVNQTRLTISRRTPASQIWRLKMGNARCDDTRSATLDRTALFQLVSD